jgi:hypothetical protein
MKTISDYESRVDALVKKWDARIDELTQESRHATPELRHIYDDEISLLIGNREAARRGLLRVSDSDDSLCFVCAENDKTNDATQSRQE